MLYTWVLLTLKYDLQCCESLKDNTQFLCPTVHTDRTVNAMIQEEQYDMQRIMKVPSLWIKLTLSKTVMTMVIS